MSYYARRDNQLNTTSNAGNLVPAATYTVYVLEPGAVVQSAAAASNTVRVHKGHGFAASDKFLVGASASQFCEISSIDTSQAAYDTLTLTGGTTVTAAQGAVLINLGQDTGSASPNYDADAISIYNDPNGATALSSSSATTDSAGNYGYWVAAGEVWELIVSDGSPEDYIVGIYPYVKRSTAASGTDVVVESAVAGEAFVRHDVDAAGKHQWGSGSAAVDTNLYRSAADTLKTDDALVVGSTLAVTGASTLTGNVAAQGTLAVTGASTLTGDVEVDGALNHDGATAGFYGATPVARPGATDDIKDALTNLGLLQGTSATPLNLDGGDLSAANVTTTGYAHKSITTGITASTTQTQGQQVLTTEVNEVSTCAVASDVVTLPTAVAGRKVYIRNNGAQVLQIFPNTSDSIDGGTVDAADTSTLAAGAGRLYVAADATDWITVI